MKIDQVRSILRNNALQLSVAILFAMIGVPAAPLKAQTVQIDIQANSGTTQTPPSWTNFTGSVTQDVSDDARLLTYLMNGSYANGNTNAQGSISIEVLGPVVGSLPTGTFMGGTLPEPVGSAFASPNPSGLAEIPPFHIGTLVRMRGSLNAYSFHIGLGVGTYQRATASFSFSDTLLVSTTVPMTIGIPVHLSASALGAESFGEPTLTTGTAFARINGIFGNQSFADEVLADSVSVIPIIDNTDYSAIISIAVPAGISVIPFSVSGEAGLLCTAQSTGFFGSLSGAATAQVTFPNTIEIGLFTDGSGNPLPNSVTITSQSSGLVYTNVPEPASLALLAAGTVLLGFRRRSQR